MNEAIVFSGYEGDSSPTMFTANYIIWSIIASLHQFQLEIVVLSDTQHMRPLEARNRCRGTTPAPAEYTLPRGLATQTTLGFIAVSQLNEKEENETEREV